MQFGVPRSDKMMLRACRMKREWSRVSIVRLGYI